MRLISALRHGPYRPQVAVCDLLLTCEVRGQVRVVGTSSALIPWPIGARDGERQVIVYGGLAAAVMHEAPAAVAVHWGVPVDTVLSWQEKLGERAVFAVSGPRIYHGGPVWDAEQDELICRFRPETAARILGRTVHAINKRRSRIGAVRFRRRDAKQLRS